MRSKTKLYAVTYWIRGWVYPILRRVSPNYLIRSDELAQGLIEVARQRPQKRVLERADLRALTPAG